jgi:hypothetical protein
VSLSAHRGRATSFEQTCAARRMSVPAFQLSRNLLHGNPAKAV